jgi:hypothetical protein
MIIAIFYIKLRLPTEADFLCPSWLFISTVATDFSNPLKISGGIYRKEE